jgi:hypothetical protein
MDDFANLVEYVETVSATAPPSRGGKPPPYAAVRVDAKTPQSARVPAVKPVKVALIDDGVKTSRASLDDNILCGKSGWATTATTAPAAPNAGGGRRPARASLRNYNSSHTGHGTVMAYYICRVCPKVKLCVAKLEPQTRPKNDAGADSGGEQVTFSIESVTEVSWLVLVILIT